MQLANPDWIIKAKTLTHTVEVFYFLLNWQNLGVLLHIDYKNLLNDIAYGCIIEYQKLFLMSKQISLLLFLNYTKKEKAMPQLKCG